MLGFENSRRHPARGFTHKYDSRIIQGETFMAPNMPLAQSLQRSALELLPTGISDLPNELLNLILHLIQDEDLLALAVLCQRLNAVALAIYLSRSKVDGRILHLSTLGTPFHALKGVRLSFRYYHLQSLLCYFSENIVEEMKEVQRTLESISTVGRVLLKFPIGVDMRKDRFPTLLALLDSLGGVSCTDFEAGGTCVTFPERSILPRPLLDLKTVSFICSPFLSPSFRQWTTQSLNSSPITNLYLDDVINLHLFLASLKLPALLDCYISCTRLPVQDLLTFLDRHPSITSLYVNRGDYQLPVPQNSPMWSLPRLSYLSSRPDFIIYFLLSPQAVPSVTTVQLITGGLAQRPDKLDFSSLGEAFILIAKQPKIVSLSLTLEASPEMRKWLRVERHPSPRSLAPSVDKFHLRYITKLTVDEANGVVDLIPQWLALFPSLENLVIICYQNRELDSKSQKASFVKLIHEYCPTLNTISFDRWSPTSVAQWLTNDGSEPGMGRS
jgi:hypothetical protein